MAIMPPSIYKLCADAARRLISDPSLHAESHRGFFTDLDVVALASRGQNWTQSETEVALSQANDALKHMYRYGDVARFGPVWLEHIARPDYARIATRIAHAAMDGPEILRTPNGDFSRVVSSDDMMKTAGGRRFGINRDDTKPWDDQPEVALSTARARLRAQ